MGKILAGAAVVLLIVFSLVNPSRAAHPLITDDAGTVGKGSVQMELNYEYAHERNEGVKENEHEIETVVTYGLIDQVDLVLALPFLFTRSEEEGSRDREEGIGDMSFEVKWRFYECNGLSLALKPGITFPTGEDDRGLGTGRVGATAFFIASQEWEPWAFHFNLGYMRNENKVDERRDLYHVSLAAEWEVAKWVKLVGNVGAEANTDRTSDTPAAFILGGLIFPVTEWLEVDVGIKGGLTRPEADYSLLAGMCFHF
jgi:hypothetical protein